jgi:hypothetical protein
MSSVISPLMCGEKPVPQPVVGVIKITGEQFLKGG